MTALPTQKQDRARPVSVETIPLDLEDSSHDALIAEAIDVPSLLSTQFSSAEDVSSLKPNAPEMDVYTATPAVARGDYAGWHNLAKTSRISSLREGPQTAVTLGPGLVQLTAKDEAKAERTRARLADRPTDYFFEGHCAHCEGYRNIVKSGACDACSCHSGPAADFPPVIRSKPKRQITEWSAKSRANLIRTIASTDFRSMMSTGIPCMVTLTYPNSWRLFAPSAEVAHGHARAFAERLARLHDSVHGEAARHQIWKMEAQRRGAPHFHVLVAIPKGMVTRCPSKCGDRCRVCFRGWCRNAWSDIISSTVDPSQAFELFGDDWGLLLQDEIDKGRRAGVNVDLRQGLRMRDPRRVAAYFCKHSGANAKEYQHQFPPDWAEQGTGRWWGVRGFEKLTRTVFIHVSQWLALRDYLHSYAVMNGYSSRIFESEQLQGGFLSTRDGPALLRQASDALDLGLFPRS